MVQPVFGEVLLPQAGGLAHVHAASRVCTAPLDRLASGGGDDAAAVPKGETRQPLSSPEISAGAGPPEAIRSNPCRSSAGSPMRSSRSISPLGSRGARSSQPSADAWSTQSGLPLMSLVPGVNLPAAQAFRVQHGLGHVVLTRARDGNRDPGLGLDPGPVYWASSSAPVPGSAPMTFVRASAFMQ